MRVAFRCDGDDRVGAGHVARSLEIAAAFLRVGATAMFVGHYEGLAAELLAAARVEARPPGSTVAGVPPDAEAVVVDSYEIPRKELERLARRVPVAALSDGDGPLDVAAVLSYHPWSGGGPPVGSGTVALLGPDYAPVSPRLVAARRERGLARALVSVGGSHRGRPLVDLAVRALEEIGDLELLVAGEQGSNDAGLLERIAWADVAVSAAGFTAYELACAGVPSVVVAMVDNQVGVATRLASRGAVRGLDGRVGELEEERLFAEVGLLASPQERAGLAVAGPGTVDGYGAARAREALVAVFAGRPPPRVLGYRPARLEDSALVLGWRNDPDVRAASRGQDPVGADEHAQWLGRVLADPDRTLLVVQEGGVPVGSLRFDRHDGQAEISVAIAAQRRGYGIGAQAVREGTELLLAAYPDIREIFAEVRQENTASLSAFERAGYRPVTRELSGMRLLRADAAAMLA